MTVLATDDFNRADGAIGANWSNLADAFVIATNKARSGSGTTDSITISTYTNATWPNNQYAQCVIGSPVAVSDEGVGPIIRCSDANNLYIAQGNTVETKLYKRVGGAFTQLGSDGAAVADGDTLYVEAQGTSILVKKNGSTIIGPVTDAALSAGNAGMWGTRQAMRADDFAGGDFVGDTLMGQIWM